MRRGKGREGVKWVWEGVGGCVALFVRSILRSATPMRASNKRCQPSNRHRATGRGIVCARREGGGLERVQSGRVW